MNCCSLSITFFYSSSKLAGYTLFITGASRGIGKYIALKAAQDGANIVIAAKTAHPHPKLPGTIYTAAKESMLFKNNMTENESSNDGQFNTKVLDTSIPFLKFLVSSNVQVSILILIHYQTLFYILIRDPFNRKLFIALPYS